MRVQVFKNRHIGGYHDRDLLSLAWEGYISPDDGDTEGLLDEILVHFNLDTRPNAKIRTPVTTGDVITIEGGPRRLCESYAVIDGGFRKLKIPHTATHTEKLNLVEEMRQAGIRAIPRLPRFRRFKETTE